MNKALGVAVVASAAAATATLTAAPAHAIVCTASQGAQYVTILTQNGIYNDLGPH